MSEGKKLLTRAVLQQMEKKSRPGCVIAALEFLSVAVFAAGMVGFLVAGVMALRSGNASGALYFVPALMFAAIPAFALWMLSKSQRLKRGILNGTIRPVEVACVTVYHTRMLWDSASECPSTLDANGEGSYIWLTFRDADGKEYKDGFFADASPVHQGDRFYILREVGAKQRWPLDEWTFREDAW